jgi:hypothetical protein
VLQKKLVPAWFSGGTTETAIRLVGQPGEDSRGFVYGVAFVDEGHDFWELKFPPPPVWNVHLEPPISAGRVGAVRSSIKAK